MACFIGLLAAGTARAQSLGGPTYGQSTFNTPTYQSTQAPTMQSNQTYSQATFSPQLSSYSRAASIILTPFGGRIIGVGVPCTCPASALVSRLNIMTPFGPIVLDYVKPTQAFLSYNLPVASYLLGFYTRIPVSSPATSCYDYSVYSCYPRVTPPAMGTINSIVGSSPR